MGQDDQVVVDAEEEEVVEEEVETVGDTDAVRVTAAIAREAVVEARPSLRLVADDQGTGAEAGVAARHHPREAESRAAVEEVGDVDFMFFSLERAQRIVF